MNENKDLLYLLFIGLTSILPQREHKGIHGYSHNLQQEMGKRRGQNLMWRTVIRGNGQDERYKITRGL